MSIEFVWKVDSLDVNPSDGDLNNVVVSCVWTCVASDGDKSFSVGSKKYLGAPSDSFIEFDALTQSDVLGWVWANGIDKAAVEQTAAAGLQNAPVIKVGPWKASEVFTAQEVAHRPWL